MRGGRALLLGALVVAGAPELGAQATSIRAVSCSTARTKPAAPTLRWRGTAVRWAEWPVELGATRVRNRLIVVLVDPARVAVSLDIARRGDALAPWNIDVAPTDVALALNAGQFTDDGPWGWVRHNGRDQQAPGSGTLAGALVVDTTGRVAILPAAQLAAARQDARWREAVQSYPQLLAGGAPLPAVCGGDALDLTHRDARLVVGVRTDGTVVIVMSRFAGTGSRMAPGMERVPIGPTTPEMAEVARRLGAVDALMLDGGLSAQLLVRDGTTEQRWPGLRAVPLALVGRVR
ncbi:MAG: phosphodiester glycosidase family protein [Gemmatimonadaceae bacterium]|nr:phosphodiester glycosidase family protein [Gemmatimonadaceae bacterium]